MASAYYRAGMTPPEWARQEMDSLGTAFSGIDGPVDFFEGMGQSFCDTYEKEGVAYIAGAITCEVAISVVPFSKIAKIGTLGKGTKLANAGGDAARGMRAVARQTDEFGEYATKIDSKAYAIERQALDDWVIKTFKDGEYRTVVTSEDIVLYR